MATVMREFQKAACKMIEAEVSQGGVFTLGAPLGGGRSVVLAEAVARKTVLFVSEIREMREQFKRFCGHADCAGLREARDLHQEKPYDVVVVSDRLAYAAKHLQDWGGSTVIALP